MTIMLNNTPITFSEILCLKTVKLESVFIILPAKKLPGQKAGDQGHVVKVSVGNKISEHSQ